MAAGERRGVQRSGERGDDGFVRGIFCGRGVRSEGFLVFLGMGKKGGGGAWGMSEGLPYDVVVRGFCMYWCSCVHTVGAGARLDLSALL